MNSKNSVVPCLIRSVAERRSPQKSFELTPPFDIHDRQVALVQGFVQLLVLLFSPFSTLPPMLCIHTVLCILIAIKSLWIIVLRN
jgi:hypothetical protein